MSKRQKILAKQRTALDKADRDAAAAVDAAMDLCSQVEDRQGRQVAARMGGVR